MLFFLIAVGVAAQQKSPTLENLERQMLELQRQMIQEFNRNPFGGGFFTFPETDSSYTFRFDTTITGDNFSGSFHFGPFGGDSTMRGDDPFEWLRKQFFGDGQESDIWGRSAPERTPDETDPGAEHLLPEERLRLEEEQSEKGTPQKSSPATPAKPKIKSIRI